MDVTHSNVYSLSGNDIFLDSWNEGYVGQGTVWNNSKIWLFQITIGCGRLNHEIIVVMLAA
jgi:hypothetical protein